MKTAPDLRQEPRRCPDCKCVAPERVERYMRRCGQGSYWVRYGDHYCPKCGKLIAPNGKAVAQ